MCHHVELAIDWDEVVETTDTRTDKLDTADENVDPAVDGETPPELTPPADD
jgi:hypothetical protein